MGRRWCLRVWSTTGQLDSGKCRISYPERRSMLTVCSHLQSLARPFHRVVLRLAHLVCHRRGTCPPRGLRWLLSASPRQSSRTRIPTGRVEGMPSGSDDSARRRTASTALDAGVSRWSECPWTSDQFKSISQLCSLSRASMRFDSRVCFGTDF